MQVRIGGHLGVMGVGIGKIVESFACNVQKKRLAVRGEQMVKVKKPGGKCR